MAPVKKVSKKSKAGADPLFPKRPRTFRIGGDIRPAGRDLTRYVKWPRYIRLQRQRKVLMQRLKVPPQINQFQKPLTKNQATELFRVLSKYQPESKAEKAARLKAKAEKQAAGEEVKDEAPPPVLKYGLNHVTTLIEEKKAKLVVIAHNVNPIELVIWMPALCRKMDVPYCIVKDKSRLGTLVHQKTAACVAITAVGKEDEPKLETLCNTYREEYNESTAAFRQWGGGIMGHKTLKRLELREKAIQAELAKKQQY